MRIAFVTLLASLLVGCAANGPPVTDLASASSLATWAPVQLEDGWNVASAEDVALDPCILDSMTASIHRGEDYPNVHSVLIVKDNNLVYEQYFYGEDLRYSDDERQRVSLTFHADTLHDSRSVAKSVTSALVGIALGSGAIASLDVPLLDYFPEHVEFATPEKRKITLRPCADHERWARMERNGCAIHRSD